LYENKSIINAKDAAQLISSLLERFGLRPGRSSLKWKDATKATHPRWSKIPDLADEDSDRELEYLALEDRPVDPPTSIANHHQIDIRNESHSSVFSISSRKTPNGLLDILSVAKVVLPICRPRYGFVTSLGVGQSGILYSAGIPYNASTEEDRARQFEFQHALHLRFTNEQMYRDQLRKKLRDLYPVNFLTKGHLARRIAGLSMEAWITKRDYGTLTEIHLGIWMWQLSDEQLSDARGELLNAGALIVTQ
jgi:hypothetical protein